MVARRAHNPEVAGSNPAPATNEIEGAVLPALFLFRLAFPPCPPPLRQVGCASAVSLAAFFAGFSAFAFFPAAFSGFSGL